MRYERTIDGLRVVGGDLVSHRDASGAVESVTWNVRKSVTPLDDHADDLEEHRPAGRARGGPGHQREGLSR